MRTVETWRGVPGPPLWRRVIALHLQRGSTCKQSEQNETTHDLIIIFIVGLARREVGRAICVQKLRGFGPASQTWSVDLWPTCRRSLSGHLGPILSALRRLQEASKLTFFGSRSLQERSKRPPRGFLRASASKMRFGSHFGSSFASQKRSESNL